MSDAKPVDLAAIRARYWSNDTDVGDVPAMADRIEALEAGLREAVGMIEEFDGSGIMSLSAVSRADVNRLRALLPPS